MKSQSKRTVTQLIAAVNMPVASSGNASVMMTNTIVISPEIAKTGLWMSTSMGPMVVTRLS